MAISKRKSLFLLLPCFLFGCVPDSSNQHIPGKQIFDVDLGQSKPTESFTLEEIPGAQFVLQSGSDFFIDGRPDLQVSRSLYIADANNDGFMDICTGFSKGSLPTFGVCIFDYHNNAVLRQFDARLESDFFIDIEKNSLVLLDAQPTGNMNGERRINRRGYFLKTESKELSLEWQDADFELLRIESWISSNYSNQSSVKYSSNQQEDKKTPILYVGQSYVLKIRLIHHGLSEKNKNFLGDCAVFQGEEVFESEFLEQQADDLSYRIAFSETGIKNVVVKIGNQETIISADVRE